MQSGDTIVAISSATGAEAARTIVRLSGPDSPRIASDLLDPRALANPGGALIRGLRIGNLAPFPVWVYNFAAPRSVTGEDVVELHLPGGTLLPRMLLDELTRCGARQADAGEFTARAFFSGRIDLTEAEGVAAIVSANSQADLDAARRLISGELARRLAPTMDDIVKTLGLVEAGIDFVDQDIAILPEAELRSRVDGCIASLRSLLSESSRFERLSHEPQVVLAGRPNAGKSTLLNALAGYERAIVSPVAGTTRDALGATVRLARGLIHVVDVAGVEVDTNSEVERKMHATALRSIETADVVVLVRDVTDDRPSLELMRAPQLIAVSKTDLRPRPSGTCCVSAVTGEGMDELRQRLDELCFGPAAMAISAGLALTARHVRSIESAIESLNRAMNPTGPEIVALELREALDALGSILGQVTPDAVLDHVFATFCIGK